MLTTPTTTCNYPNAGTFTTAVTVRDTEGLTSRATTKVRILASVPPTAALSLSKSSIKSGQSITADASGSTDPDKSPITTYQFSCGTGTVLPPQSSPTATCTYPSTGTFQVKVTVTDTDGLSDTATKAVKVQ